MARREASDLPFRGGEVGLRLNALRRDDHPSVVGLSVAELAILRALISLADWRTGEIPSSLDVISKVAGPHRNTVSESRTKFETLGLIRECWRAQKQVKYALTDLFRIT